MVGVADNVETLAEGIAVNNLLACSTRMVPIVSPLGHLWCSPDQNGQFWRHDDPILLGRWIENRNELLSNIQAVLDPQDKPHSTTSSLALRRSFPCLK